MDLIKTFKNRSITTIKNAQKNALINVFKKIEYLLESLKFLIKTRRRLEHYFHFILETVLIGKLLNLNPFDQPAVERKNINEQTT